MLGILTAVIVIGFPVTLGLAYLAGHANLLFTLVREGTAKAVVRSGRLHKFIMSYKRNRQNNPWSIFYNPDQPDWKVLESKFRLYLFNFYFWRNLVWLIITLPVQIWLKGFEYFGVYFVGPVPYLYSVYVRENWKWNEWERNDSGVYVLRPRVGSTDFIYVNKFTYGFVLEGAEAKGGMPLKVVYAVTVDTPEPSLALFAGGDDWIDRATVLFHERTKQFTGNFEPEELLKMREDGTSYQAFMLVLNDRLPGIADQIGGLLGERGIRIVDARIDSIDPSGTPEEQARYRTIWLTKHLAQQEADAAVITAKGKAEAIVIEAEAQGKAYDTVIARGQPGLTLAALNTMEKSGQTGKAIVWANNPFAGIDDLIKGITKKE